MPLSVRGAQQCVAFARAGGHLHSVAVCEAGFMPLAGAMANADIRLPVPGRPGVHVIAAPGTAVNSRLIAAGLDAGGPAMAVGVVANELEAFGSLRRWLALRAPAAATLMYAGPAEAAEPSGVPRLVEFSAGGVTQRLSRLPGDSGFVAVDLARGGPAACGQGSGTAHERAVRACGTADHETRRLAELVRAWDAAQRPGADRLLIDAYPSGVAVPDTGGSVYRPQHMTFLVSSR